MERGFWAKAAVVETFGTQRRAAAALEIDQGRLSILLRGRRAPTSQEAVKLANFFGTKFVTGLRRNARALSCLERAAINAPRKVNDESLS